MENIGTREKNDSWFFKFYFITFYFVQSSLTLEIRRFSGDFTPTLGYDINPISGGGGHRIDVRSKTGLKSTYIRRQQFNLISAT